MVSRKWIGEGTGRRSYKREDAGGRGAGWLRKGFGFKRSPSTRPDQTRPDHDNTDGRCCCCCCWVGLCGLVGLWAGWRADAVPPTWAKSSAVLFPPLHWRERCMLAALGTSGTLPWRRNGGTGHLWAPGHGRPEKGVCVLGPVPWALSGTSQGEAGTEEEGASSSPNGSRVTGLQVSSGQVSEIC